MHTTFARIALALMFLSAVLATGCRRRSHDSDAAPDDDIFTSDEFPGAPVQDGNVADDKRAFSPSGKGATGLSCTFNGDHGTALATYQVVDSAGDPAGIYAHYYDGESWTPPVLLKAQDVQYGEVEVYKTLHVFFNTANHASADARERDGDAVILWVATDIDDGEGEDSALWATWFDSDSAGDPGANFGFQEEAMRLDIRDSFAENIENVGIATDGLCGEARWQIASRSYQQGQDTTAVVVFWIELEDNFPGGGLEDQAMYACRFDPAAPFVAGTPLAPSPASRLPIEGFGASDSGALSGQTQVFPYMVASYNNLVLFRAVATTSGLGLGATVYGLPLTPGLDITMQVLAFDLATGAVSSPESLHLVSPDATDTIENAEEFVQGTSYGYGSYHTGHSFLGSDEGLAETLIFTCQLVNDPDGETDFGDAANDGRLVVSRLNGDTGAVVESVPIDLEQPTASDTVYDSQVDVVVSRNADYVWIGWGETSDSGASDDLAVWAAQLATRRFAEDGTPQADSPFSDRLSAPIPLSPDVDGFDCGFHAFQRGLSYRCGCQSDPDVVNMFFEISDSTQDTVHHARLTADLVLPGVTPTVAVTPFETFEEDDLLGVFGPNLGNNDFVAADAGADGECVTFYRKHIDPAGVDDDRLFSRRTGGGTAVEVGSAVPGRTVDDYLELALAITPPGEEVGFFDPAASDDDPRRTHAASRVHVFFYEDAISEMDGLGDEMRTRAYVAELSGGADGDAYVPNAGASFQPPFEIGLGGTPPELDQFYDLGGIEVAGDRVGVYFADSGHIYYQEYNPEGEPSAGWRNIDGFPDPILVDDDSEFETESIYVFTRSCTCETLSQATVFWNKVFAPAEGPEGRLQVRVREEE